jgi:hypothetical protein
MAQGQASGFAIVRNGRSKIGEELPLRMLRLRWDLPKAAMA